MSTTRREALEVSLAWLNPDASNAGPLAIEPVTLAPVGTVCSAGASHFLAACAKRSNEPTEPTWGACAFTPTRRPTGSLRADVFFRAGAHRPDSDAGLELLAHEVAHGRIATGPRRPPVDRRRQRHHPLDYNGKKAGIKRISWSEGNDPR